MDYCNGCSMRYKLILNSSYRLCHSYNLDTNAAGLCPCTECIIISTCHIEVKRETPNICEKRVDWSHETYKFYQTDDNFKQQVNGRQLLLLGEKEKFKTL